MKEQLQRLEKTIETQQQAQSAQRTTTKRNTNDNDSDSDDERDRQIILHGFAADSDEATVTTFTNKLLHDNALSNNVEKVFTFTTPSHIGVIQFKSTSAKAGFFKKMRNITIKCPHNDAKTMSWTDNNSFEERAIHKQLGFFKHYLHTKHNIPLADIRIRRDRHTIKLRNNTTAVKPGPDGNLIATTDEALAVQDDVTAAIEAWKRKMIKE